MAVSAGGEENENENENGCAFIFRELETQNSSQGILRKKMGAECHSIEEKIDFKQLFDLVDTVAVVYPIYGSCVPRIMREFVALYMEEFQKKKLIIFCTQMVFSGDGAKGFCEADT